MSPLLELGIRNLAAWSLQVGVLALTAALLARLVPIERPAARLAFSQTLLVVILALPLLQPWIPMPSGVTFTLSSVTLPGSPATSRVDSPGGALAWPVLAAGFLGLGMTFRLGQLAAGLFRLRSLRRSAQALAEPPWLRALRDEMVPRAIFVISDRAGAPATFGLRRPIVLLPPVFPSMPIESQEAIALHELVHARRGDWLALTLEEVLKAALFFHPAVHWLVSRVRLAREQTVDAVVVERLGHRETYLDSLVAVARFVALARAVPAAPFLRESHLRERVDLLLKEVPMSRIRVLAHAGLTAAALVLAATWAVSAAPLQSSSPGLSNPTTAHFAAVDRDVQVRRVGTREWIPATPTLVLRPGDFVRTASGASAAIRFADGKVVHLRPESMIEVDEATPDPGALAGEKPVAPANEPRITHKVNPAYPPEAKADKAEGVFLIDLSVGRDGTVTDARVVASAPTADRLKELKPKAGSAAAAEGDPRLAEAALAAVRQWRYEPRLTDGKPVEFKLTVTINFRLQ